MLLPARAQLSPVAFWKNLSSAALQLLAGSTVTPGSIDGTGAAARFNNPWGVAFDSSGNLYVADSQNGVIRKITSAGVVTTFAGSSGVQGSADGTGPAASFLFPSAVAVDGSGNVFVADTYNSTIRKITSAGVVTTFAGTAGVPGYSDGTGAAANFIYPVGVAIDGSGNLYVADTYACTIRKITSAGVVTTFAGTAGVPGSADGTGTSATFNYPSSVAVDGAGNVFVADSQNYVIRKITSAGVVTTLAGTVGSPGSLDGVGAAARFLSPQGIAIDASGNLYISDNVRIRKVTSAGVVTTLTGSGSSGSADGVGTAVTYASLGGLAVASNGDLFIADAGNNTIRKASVAANVTTFAGLSGSIGSTDGTGSAARFNTPYNMARDSSGNMYIADSGNHTIRKITSAGVVTTFAGTAGSLGSANGTGAAARFNSPSDIAIDSSDNLYVADSNNHTIRKITSAGVVTTFAGTAGSSGTANGTGAAARFSGPGGITVDSGGTLYVSDTDNHTIRKITSAAVVTTFAGSAGLIDILDGMGSAARFQFPAGITIDSGGTLYVADSGSHTIRKITSAGLVTTFAGSGGFAGSADGTGASARFSAPWGLKVDSSGVVYVADQNNGTIRRISSAGAVTTPAGTAGVFSYNDGVGASAMFNYPCGLTLGADGNLYVADTSNEIIRQIVIAPIVVTTFAGSPLATGSADGTGAAARFNNPQGLSVDGSGNVYVADTTNHIIRKITSAGVVTTLAGLAGNPGNTNGTGAAARFNNPQGVAVDSGGNVYVADSSNSVIRKVTSAGVVTTLAGLAGTPGGVDGTGSAARFTNPNGIAVDAGGTVYVSESGNHTIRKITSAGVVTTLAGSFGVQGSADGTGAAASFNSPLGIAVDGSGNVYVADYQNYTIRKITSAGVVTTFVGTAGNIGSADGTGAAASFSFPIGLAIDASNTLYVGDAGNRKVRKVTSAGVVTTVVGNGMNETVLGPLPARTYEPHGVAVSATKLFLTSLNAVLWAPKP